MQLEETHEKSAHPLLTHVNKERVWIDLEGMVYLNKLKARLEGWKVQGSTKSISFLVSPTLFLCHMKNHAKKIN